MPGTLESMKRNKTQFFFVRLDWEHTLNMWMWQWDRCLCFKCVSKEMMDSVWQKCVVGWGWGRWGEMGLVIGRWWWHCGRWHCRKDNEMPGKREACSLHLSIHSYVTKCYIKTKHCEFGALEMKLQLEFTGKEENLKIFFLESYRVLF